MISSMPRSSAKIASPSLHPLLVPLPIVCFAGTFLSDITYALTAQSQWTNLSSWLLAIGLAVSVLAVIAGLVDVLSEPKIRTRSDAWIQGVGNSIVLILALGNAVVHSHEGYASLIPASLALSGVVVALLLITSWQGWIIAHRQTARVKGRGSKPEALFNA